MARYADATQVPVDQSRTEIERTLQRFGATRFAYGWQPNRAVIGFTIGATTARMALPLPTRAEVAHTPTGIGRTAAQTDSALEKETRRRWRALAAVVKAKLVAVEEGITTVEREFAADVVLPDGQTVGEWLAPQLAGANHMPALLPGS